MTDYLLRRGKSYSFRIAVPARLRRHFNGRREIVQALGTRDYDIAKAKALKLAHEHKMRFLALEGRKDAQSNVARLEYERTRQEALSGAFEVHLLAPDPDEAPPNPHVTGIDFEIERIIEEEARRRGVNVHAGDPLPADLQARIDALQDASRELRGEPAPPRAEYEPPFRELADDWLKQWKARPGRKPSNTGAQYASTIRLFADWWGAKPIRKVRPVDAAKFVEEALKRLPPNYGRSKTGNRRPLQEILAAVPEGATGLSASSVNRHVRTLKAIWSWAKKLGYCEGDNPFDGLRERLTTHNSKPYVAWEIDELKRLLDPPPKRRDLYEVILVAMFSAMRVSEIADMTWGQLRRSADGIWYFQVADAKTEAGNRKIPVHSRLSWITERKRGPDDARIWPRFNPEGPGRKAGEDASRMFSAFKHKRGFSDRRKTFHSFRKNVTRIMEDHGIPPNQWARIIGHEPGFTYGTYNPAGLSLARMRDIIELIEYPGLHFAVPAGAPDTEDQGQEQRGYRRRRRRRRRPRGDNAAPARAAQTSLGGDDEQTLESTSETPVAN